MYCEPSERDHADLAVHRSTWTTSALPRARPNRCSTWNAPCHASRSGALKCFTWNNPSGRVRDVPRGTIGCIGRRVGHVRNAPRGTICRDRRGTKADVPRGTPDVRTWNGLRAKCSTWNANRPGRCRGRGTRRQMFHVERSARRMERVRDVPRGTRAMFSRGTPIGRCSTWNIRADPFHVEPLAQACFTWKQSLRCSDVERFAQAECSTWNNLPNAGGDVPRGTQ